MSADYKFVDENIEYSGIKQTNVRIGQKISVTAYNPDEEGNIVSTRPIINAIDIDWNNATAVELEKPIKTTGDLIREIISAKLAIQGIRIPTSIYDLVEGANLVTFDNIEALKDQLAGKSAYEIAKQIAEDSHAYFPYQNESEWIASLKGSKGDPGEDGQSAYQIAKKYNPNIGTEQDWINSLKGASAYQIAIQTYEALGLEFPYANEREWIIAITENSDVESIVEEKVNEKLSEKQDKLIAGEGIQINNNVISASANTWINVNAN